MLTVVMNVNDRISVDIFIDDDGTPLEWEIFEDGLSIIICYDSKSFFKEIAKFI